MKDIKICNGRRALSPVIAALILSSVVIAVGGAVWHFSQGAMTIIAEDYAEAVVNMTEVISERFIVEHVNNSDTTLSVWIYNYGEVDIVVDVYADASGGASNYSTDYEVPSGELRKANISLADTSGKEVTIKVASRRGNNAYYRYLAP